VTKKAELSVPVNGLRRTVLPELTCSASARRPEPHRILQLWGDYLLDESLVLPGST
jgi:hypothetical protein